MKNPPSTWRSALTLRVKTTVRVMPWLCCALIGATLPATAQPVGNVDGYSVSTQDPVDPPGRVGRLADLTGQVWLYNPDEREWVSAERNRPLTSGDRIATDRSAHADMRVGSTVVRLDANTEIEVLRLDDDHLQLQLHRGAGLVHLRDSDLAAQFEWVTAEGRFRADSAGTYRFDRVAGNTQATVLEGQLQYEGRDQAVTVESGQRAEFRVDASGRAQYAIGEPKRDAFAAWTVERDRSERDVAESQRYVSPEMTGAEELDRHGIWEQDPEYGALWIPRDVAPGWAPYTTGRWAWVQPWGWTWVDVAPWGFAPFHYGRWVQRGRDWGWAPGRYVSRPVYAPALVGWVGAPPVHRPGVNIAISIGQGSGRGWFPLAPRDRYVPGFRSSPRYQRELNHAHDDHDRFDPRGPRDSRDSRSHRGDDRPPTGLPHPHVDRGVPDSITTLPPQFGGGRVTPAPNMAPIRSRPDDHGSSRRHHGNDDDADQAPSIAVPPAGVSRPTPSTGGNVESSRQERVRLWQDQDHSQGRRNGHQPAARPVQTASPQQAIERGGDRQPPRGADSGDVRRERPTVRGDNPRGDGSDRRNAR